MGAAFRAIARSIIHCKAGDDQINNRGKEISGRKDNDGDPQDRKIEQPVAHLATMSGRCEVERNANCHKQR